MQDIIDNIIESLSKYYTRLSNLGNINYADTSKIVILTYIASLLNDTTITLTDEENKSIIDLLYKMYGSSCIITYP